MVCLFSSTIRAAYVVRFAIQEPGKDGGPACSGDHIDRHLVNVANMERYWKGIDMLRPVGAVMAAITQLSWEQM